MAKRAKRELELKLDLGCGENKQTGFVGVDSHPAKGVDVVHDLRVRPWPWKDASVDETYSSHFLEHLSGEERLPFMEELYRVLRPGALARFVMPYWGSERSVQDPTHRWPPLVPASFLYFNRGWREANKLTHYLPDVDFDFGYDFLTDPIWKTKSEDARQFAFRHYTNAIQDFVVTMTKRG